MPSGSVSAEEPPVSQRSSVAASAGLGVFAAVIGYLLTYLLVASEVREAVGDTVPEWKAVAWFFYEAHLVAVEVSGQIGSFAGMSTLELIASRTPRARPYCTWCRRSCCSQPVRCWPCGGT